MDISVIVCTYNRCSSLKDTLLSLIEQEYMGFRFEIIIVDNNSTDDTCRVVDQASRSDKVEIRYILEKQQGLSFARNTGILAAKGDIIAFTDDDALPHKHWVSNMHKVFTETGAVCVGGKVEPVWNFQIPKWLMTEGPFSLRSPLCIYNKGEKIHQDVVVVGANMAFRKWVFEKYGNFRTDLSGSYRHQDTALCQQLLNEGEKLIYSPDLVVDHVIFPERTKKSFFRKWYYSSGKSCCRVDLKKEVAVPFLFGSPRYHYRELIGFLMSFIVYTLRRDPVKSFFYETRAWKALGAIVEARAINRSH